MLRHLVIHNVALIDKVELELNEGMNILTGETGAGKSVIIGSLSAILGERVSRDMIRTGSEKAFVEAVFNVDFAKSIGFYIKGLTFSPVKGPEGNIEYLLYITKNVSEKNELPEVSSVQVVDEAHAELNQ